MRVVLFCGGLGLRMRSVVEEDPPRLQRRAADAPKPMTVLGGQPLLWHMMRWYAHWGHTDFILCLGHRGDIIRDWCLQMAYEDLVPRSTAVPASTRRVRLIGGEGDGWDITLVDTGHGANVGQRLRAVRGLVEDEELFLANYTDGLSDVVLPDLVEEAKRSRAIATFVTVPLSSSLHRVSLDSMGTVRSVTALSDEGVWINGGFFVLRQEIFDVLHEGEELVVEPFARLIVRRELSAVAHHGFWVALDTAKERYLAELMWQNGRRPWAVWESPELLPSLQDADADARRS